MIDDDARRVVQSELRAGERLLWASKPITFPINKVSLMLTISVFVWTLIAIGMMSAFFIVDRSKSIPFPFSFIPVLLVLVGVCLFLYCLKLIIAPSHQVYAITDQRGIIVSPFLGYRTASLDKTLLLNSERKGFRLNSTLQFGPKPSMMGLGMYQIHLNQFYNISDAQEVEALIHKTFAS